MTVWINRPVVDGIIQQLEQLDNVLHVQIKTLTRR